MPRDTDAEPEYHTHAIVLRDIVTPDDPRCPDGMGRGAVVASYRATFDAATSYRENREVSTRLPVECLVLFTDGRIDVDGLTPGERDWLQAASAAHSNEIDFAGTETGPEVGA